MKAIPLILSAVLLAGCATKVPVAMKFPSVPAELLTSCEDLELVELNEQQLSELMKVVVANYGRYHECRLKLDNWIEWYNAQKEISDSVTKK